MQEVIRSGIVANSSGYHKDGSRPQLHLLIGCSTDVRVHFFRSWLTKVFNSSKELFLKIILTAQSTKYLHEANKCLPQLRRVGRRINMQEKSKPIPGGSGHQCRAVNDRLCKRAHRSCQVSMQREEGGRPNKQFPHQNAHSPPRPHSMQHSCA